MRDYVEELEKLIADELIPAYLEHHRLLGRPSPINKLNSRLLSLVKQKKKIPWLLQRHNYG